MAVRIFKYACPSGWDEMLYSAECEGGLLQSHYWARVLSSIDKAVPYFVRVQEENKIVGQALVMKRYPFDRKKERKVFPFPYLECLDGPVIFDSQNASLITEAILRTTLRLARNCLATNVRFSPTHNSKWNSDGTMANIYKDFGFKKEKWATYLVDLRPKDEKLFKGLEHAARKCVKKCRHKGLKVIKMRTFQEFKAIYWEAYVRSRKYFGKKANPCFPVMWEEDKKGYYHYHIVADGDHKVLACLGMYIFNGLATEIASSISPEAYEKKLPAQDLIHWEMMLEAKRMGCHTFDLAGVNPDPRTPKEVGIRRFKKKWGGKYVEYNIFQKNMMPMLTRIGNSARAMRNRFREEIFRLRG